ncbi:MAG: hypothetical protein JXD23_17410 [Spirochaetales bacterium]|nr:hypothetical protein [Spirochaetales bacterium]
MEIVPPGQHIRLPDSAGAKALLRAGESVAVNIIKQISSFVWAVGVKGSVFRARTELQLSAGETLRAVVVRNGAHLELKLANSEPNALASTLQKAGLPRDALATLIVSALITWRVKIDERAVECLKWALRHLKGDQKRIARTLGLLVAKGIEPDSRELPALAEMFDYGSGGERRDRRGEKKWKRERRPFSEEEAVAGLSAVIEGSAERRPGLLALLNHLPVPAGADNWLVVPYRIGEPEEGLSGTVRFLYDEASRVIRKTVIVAYSPEGERYQFSIIPASGGYRLSVFSGEKRLVGLPLARFTEELGRLKALGVVCDEKIRSDAEDDGFEPEIEGDEYRHVDLEG